MNTPRALWSMHSSICVHLPALLLLPDNEHMNTLHRATYQIRPVYLTKGFTCKLTYSEYTRSSTETE
ncbi:hypothetical protein BD311DRAFT_758487, partial [Dichomitus squalens]